MAEKYENFTKAMQQLVEQSELIPAEAVKKLLQQHNIPKK